jgi:hypothetical protein
MSAPSSRASRLVTIMSGVSGVTVEIPVVACIWDRAFRPVPVMTAHPQNGVPRWFSTLIRLYTFGPGMSLAPAPGPVPLGDT